MPQRVTETGLNCMVTTTLSEAEREEMEQVRLAMVCSASGFVRRAIRMLLMEQRTNEVILARRRLRVEDKLC